MPTPLARRFLRGQCAVGIYTTKTNNHGRKPSTFRLIWAAFHHTRPYCTTARFESIASPRQPTLDPRLVNATVQVRGDRYGSREYSLLPSNLTVNVEDAEDDQEILNVIRRARLASLHANRNILFGAQSFIPELDLRDACRPLVKAAVADAGMYGEQPQALAALNGLCNWVAECIKREGEGSIELKNIIETVAKEEAEGGGETTVQYEAVKAIATGTPRPGHKVIGAGTYRDGKNLWEKLAREFALGGGGMALEAGLYHSCGGEIVGVEHLADMSKPYLQSAGGAMVRFFFL